MGDPNGRHLIDWHQYPGGVLTPGPGHYVVKIQDTAVATAVVKTARDANVTVEVFGTGKNKVVGYRLSFRAAPKALQTPNSLGLFYSPHTDTSPRRIETILYHDPHVRVLCFGPEPARDYLWVLRKR